MPDAKLNQLEILLVEDNDDDADWTIEALEKEDVHCNVTRVEDGEKAMAYLCKEGEYESAPQPTLMLLDLSLPKKGGLELLTEIREGDDPNLKHLPVVIMTISKDFGDAKKAANLHATYISKPVALKEFIAAVKEFLPNPTLPDKQRQILEDWASEMGRFA